MNAFDNWYGQNGGRNEAIRILTRDAWNDALEAAIKLIRSRGKKIGGAIQPSITIEELKKLKA